MHYLAPRHAPLARATAANTRVSAIGQRSLVRQLALHESACAANRRSCQVISELGPGINHHKEGVSTNLSLGYVTAMWVGSFFPTTTDYFASDRSLCFLVRALRYRSSSCKHSHWSAKVEQLSLASVSNFQSAGQLDSALEFSPRPLNATSTSPLWANWCKGAAGESVNRRTR